MPSQIESFDYGHGGAAAVVDYNHGKGGTMSESNPLTDPPFDAPGFSVPPHPGYPSNMAGYNFPSGMPYFPAGVDPAQAALIAAAYTVQAGKYVTIETMNELTVQFLICVYHTYMHI